MNTITCFYLAYTMSTICYNNAPVLPIRPMPAPPAVSAFVMPPPLPALPPLLGAPQPDGDGDQ